VLMDALALDVYQYRKNGRRKIFKGINVGNR
jgi:hypothetical protein